MTVRKHQKTLKQLRETPNKVGLSEGYRKMIKDTEEYFDQNPLHLLDQKLSTVNNEVNYKTNQGCGNCAHMLDVNYTGWLYCNISKNCPSMCSASYQEWEDKHRVRAYGVCDNWKSCAVFVTIGASG